LILHEHTHLGRKKKTLLTSTTCTQDHMLTHTPGLRFSNSLAVLLLVCFTTLSHPMRFSLSLGPGFWPLSKNDTVETISLSFRPNPPLHQHYLSASGHCQPTHGPVKHTELFTRVIPWANPQRV